MPRARGGAQIEPEDPPQQVQTHARITQLEIKSAPARSNRPAPRFVF